MYHSKNSGFVAGIIGFVMIIAINGCKKTNPENPQSTGTNTTHPDTSSAAVQTARPGVGVSQYINGFYEYLPEGYKKNKIQTYPLLICIHGAGEVGNGGSDLSKVLAYGPAKLIYDGTFPSSFTVDGQTFRFIIITPQQSATVFVNGGKAPNDYDELIEYCKSHYRVDTDRIYLTGISMGGTNLWHYLGYSGTYAKKIAAAVPMSAWLDPSFGNQLTPNEAQNIAAANVKIWQIQNYGDPTALYAWNVAAANLLEDSSPAPDPLPKRTVFNSNVHDAWDEAYDPDYKENGLNIYEWLLHYARNKTSAALVPQLPVGQIVTLKGANNMYLQNPLSGTIDGNGDGIRIGDGFEVVDAGNGKVALRNQGNFVSSADGSGLKCSTSTITATEMFTWLYNSDGSVSLRYSNGKYVSSNNGVVNCLAASIGTNEQFKIDY